MLRRDRRSACARESLIPGEHPRVRWRNLETNETTELEPSVVLLADGKGALLQDRPTPTDDFGIKTHFEGLTVCATRSKCSALVSITAGLRRSRAIAPTLRSAFPHRSLPTRAATSIASFNGSARKTRHSTGDWLRQSDVGRGWPGSLPRFGVSKSWPAGIIPLGNSCGCPGTRSAARAWASPCAVRSLQRTSS